MNTLKIAFFSFAIIAIASFTYNDRTTTIVVLDGKALLVDIDRSGSIIETYMEVPEYFISKKDHNSKVTAAKATYTRLTKEQMDQIRFISITGINQALDSFMKSNLEDLSMHYHQTYANQIEITVAENQSNRKLLEFNISRIEDYLIQYGVESSDIQINYKQDLGDEPTTFIKVVSNLKNLYNG